MQQDGDVLKGHANIKLLDTREKESANSDVMYWRVHILSEPKVPADSRSHKRYSRTEAA